MTFAISMSCLDVAAGSCVIRSLALDAAVRALRSRRTAPAKVTAKERLSEQRLVLVVPYALALVAAVGALRSRRMAPAKVTGKEGLASRDLFAKLERD